MTVKSGKSDGVVTVTPSGIPVYFQSEPKRLYKIGPIVAPKNLGNNSPEFLGELVVRAQESEHSWVEVPSVTTALEVLDKPALPWWGMGIGAEGVSVLHNMGFVRSTVLPGGQQPVLACPKIWEEKVGDKTVVQLDMNEWVVAGKDQLVMLLKHQKLTTNHAKRKAGDRGQSVHDAFEHWANTGEKPDPSIYPPTEVGYVHGLLAFLADVPSLEPLASEVLVASSEYGFAGRYDLRAKTTESHMVVVHRTPVKGPVYRQLAPGEGITDLKTSKGIYSSHSRQLEAYEQASIESGYPATDWRGILHVSAEGEYEFVRSWATFEDYRVVLEVYLSDQRMKLAERADRARK